VEELAKERRNLHNVDFFNLHVPQNIVWLPNKEEWGAIYSICWRSKRRLQDFYMCNKVIHSSEDIGLDESLIKKLCLDRLIRSL
jgi:hypothetical protein